MGARYAYLCPPRWAGGWRVTIGVPLSESIQVRVGVLRLGGEAAVRVRTRRVRGLGALVEWVGPQRLPRRPVGWRRIPCRRGSQKLLRRPPGGGGAHPPCARARQAAAPPRGPSATAPPGPPGPESRVPTWSGRGLPPPASRESRWVGDIHLYPHPGRDPICLATIAGCCTKKAVGYAIGATACGTESVMRGDRYGGPQVPDEEGEDDPPRPRPRHPGPPPPSSPGT